MIAKVKVNHCNIVNNNYQQESRVLFAFISNKSFGQLLDTSPKKKYFKKHLVQDFCVLKYDLQIKILNR